MLNINRDNLGFSVAVRSASLSHKANVFLIGRMPRLIFFPLSLFWDSLNQTAAFPKWKRWKMSGWQKEGQKRQTLRRSTVSNRPSAGFLFFHLPVGVIAYVYSKFRPVTLQLHLHLHLDLQQNWVCAAKIKMHQFISIHCARGLHDSLEHLKLIYTLLMLTFMHFWSIIAPVLYTIHFTNGF